MAYTGSKAQAGRNSKIEIGAAVGAVVPTGITGTTTSGSPTVSALTTIVGIAVGMGVTGTGIPAGATVLSVSGSSLTLSANASASGTTIALTFSLSFITIGEIKKAGLGKAAFDKEDISNFDSNLDKEYIKLMRDNGMPTFSGNRVSSDAGQLAAVAAFNDGDNAYAFRITIRKRPDQTTSGDVYTFNALVLGLQIGDIETNKSIPWDLELQITGPVTFTAGS